MAQKLDDSIINALRDGGNYVFTAVIEERRKPSQLALTAEIEQVTQNATVQLDKDDILDEDVQEQVASFMQENHVIEISLNGKTVWSSSPDTRTKVFLNYGDHLSSI